MHGAIVAIPPHIRHGRGRRRRGTRRALAGLVEEELASDGHGGVRAAR